MTSATLPSSVQETLTESSVQIAEFPGIPGLARISEFLTADEEAEIIARLDAAGWSTELERRVQHYGYKYNYKARRIDDSMRVGDLPDWMSDLGARISGFFDKLPDQVIVNDYLPGQGIAPHVDCEPCFGPIVVSITLGSGCPMEFTNKTSKRVIPVWLAPRSAVILSGESRYEWQHGIPKRKSDVVNGSVVPRGRRISLTYRTVIDSTNL